MMIRAALPADEPAIRDCAQRAYTRYIQRMGQKPAPMLADYTTLIAEHKVHVACDQCGTFQGFIVFYPQGQDMMLENVAVRPEVAGNGIGRALIAFCEETAKRNGLASVILYTNEKMFENIAMYQRLCYQEIERRNENGFNRVYFKKMLAY